LCFLQHTDVFWPFPDGTGRALKEGNKNDRIWQGLNKDWFMKTSWKLLLATLVLVSCAFAQEPKQALARQASSGESKKEIVVSGAPLPAAPALEPKALPAMNPPLGDIARLAREAHNAAPKALMVVETDTAEEKTDQPEPSVTPEQPTAKDKEPSQN
jgi:hypothetical protein